MNTMNTTIVESKTQAMDRLRREGRWEDACEFREQRRLAAKREGLSRSDAVERSWREMAQAYPPLSDEEIDALPVVQFIAMGDFPPESIRHIDTGNGLSLAELWRSTCLAVALELATESKSQFGWLSVVGHALELIHDSANCDISKGALSYAIWQPRGFLLGFALQRFEALLDDDSQLGEHTDELRCFAKSIAKLSTDSVFELFGGADA